jgi:signal transduction histidine kinase
MADEASRVTPPEANFDFDTDRVAAFLRTLESMAAGQIDQRLPISPRHDTLDAIAYAINVLVGELSWASARAKEAQEEKETQLRAAVTSAEVRNGAILKAIPDLMFVLLRDGTYVDYHARDPKLLFVPPSTFIGRNMRDVLPSALADLMMDGLERACQTDDMIVVEYELPMDEPRAFEARIVQAGADRVLSIVRDVTESKRATELNRDLARRLIVRQEIERQRIARELHDDVSQRIALLNIEIDKIATQGISEESRSRLHTLSAQARDIATDVHHISYALHPSWLETLGLVAALQSLCRDASKQRNLQVAFTHNSIPSSVDANVSLCLYRIAQEALHNVARHSQVREAQVSVTCDERHIALQIADSGVGFDPRHMRSGGLGLASIRERVAVLKGQLAINAVPGGGTQITVHIPLASEGSESAPPLIASA